MLYKNLLFGLILSIIVLFPVGIKWEIQKRIFIPAALLIGILAGIIVVVLHSFRFLEIYEILAIQLLVISATSISLVLWRFFRDPERIPLESANAILAPADGRVLYIKDVKNGEIPLSIKDERKFMLNEFVESDILPSAGILIGIAMTWLDVHVNRAPISGKVTFLKHIKGLFISLKKKEAVIRNERTFLVIQNEHLKVGIVQIASRLVRNIIPYIKKGIIVKRGQRIGMIRFGSQVDVFLPDTCQIKVEVKTGQQVKAGLSILATYEAK